MAGGGGLPWYSGLINYQFNYFKCGNSSWSTNSNAFCYENAAIRIAMYSQSSSWISNLSSCQFKESSNSTPQNVDNGVSYNMNLYLATSCIAGGEYSEERHAMVAKLPSGADPTIQSFTNFTFFQYNNFQIQPGIPDPNSTFIQMGIPNLNQRLNIIRIYRVNSIYLDSETGSIRFNQTLVRQFSIDYNGVVDPL